MITINKLSEIPQDTKLAVNRTNGVKIWEFEVMDVEDFLMSEIYLDEVPCLVSIAEPVYAEFDFHNIFESMSEEMYEDWQDNFEGSLNWDIINKANEEIQKTIKNNPSYYESNNIVYKVEE